VKFEKVETVRTEVTVLVKNMGFELAAFNVEENRGNRMRFVLEGFKRLSEKVTKDNGIGKTGLGKDGFRLREDRRRALTKGRERIGIGKIHPGRIRNSVNNDRRIQWHSPI
jgi:hypothetical protein